MKKCSKCGRTYSDLISKCPSCGNILGGTSTPSVNPAPINPPPIPVEPPFQPPKPTPAPIPVPADTTDTMGKGVLGACLFGFGGAALQAALMFVGVWSSLTGIAVFYLTALGFVKYSNRSYEALSKKELLICGILAFAMIAVGTYIGCVYILSKEMGADISYTLYVIKNMKDVQSYIWEKIGVTTLTGAASCVIYAFLSRKK